MQRLKPKIYTTVSFIMIYVFCLALILVRWINVFNSNIVVINQEICSHISNFILSILICTLIGYLLLIAKSKYKAVLIVGILIVVANFVYETVLSFLNTTDIIDALYGFLGVLLSLLYLYFISKYGFEDNDYQRARRTDAAWNTEGV